MQKRTAKIRNGGTSAEINLDNGQMFSLAHHDVDVMWNGGAPEGMRCTNGWQNSEIVMFPIVGGALDNQLLVEGKSYPMGKHGLSRDLPWCVSGPYSGSIGNSIAFQQSYRAYTEVKNKDGFFSIFPKSFTLTKSYSIDEKGTLTFKLEVDSYSDNLPFAVGWHPAIRTGKDSTFDVIGTKDDMFPVKAVMFPIGIVNKSKGNVLVYDNSNMVILKNKGFDVLFTHDFNHTMLWNRDEGCTAIEPITSLSLSRIAQTKGSEKLDIALLPEYMKLKRDETKTFLAKIEIRRS